MALKPHTRAAMGLKPMLTHGKYADQKERDSQDKAIYKRHGLTPQQVRNIPSNRKVLDEQKNRTAANIAKNRALKSKMK